MFRDRILIGSTIIIMPNEIREISCINRYTYRIEKFNKNIYLTNIRNIRQDMPTGRYYEYGIEIFENDIIDVILRDNEIYTGGIVKFVDGNFIIVYKNNRLKDSISILDIAGARRVGVRTFMETVNE